MKRISWILSLGLGLTGAGSAIAATTGQITISGSIPAYTAIVVSPVAGYNSLDLSTTATDKNVATVTEINNTTTGYTVKLASANSGSLKNGSLGSVAYTAKYNGTAVTLSSTAVTVTKQSSQTSVVNANKNFSISYTGVDPTTLMVGTYSDTLTFTITAN
jgi:hypothetical protein